MIRPGEVIKGYVVIWIKINSNSKKNHTSFIEKLGLFKSHLLWLLTLL